MKLLMRDEAKGREHTIFVTIFSALMVMLAIVVMLMASATAVSGVTLQLDKNAVDILDKQVENRAGYIQDQLQQAQELTDLSTYINETAQQMLDDETLSLKTLDSSSSDSLPLLLAAAPRMLETLRSKRISGIFLILNTHDFTDRTSGDRLPCVYLRDLDPDAVPSVVNSDILLECAPSELVQTFDITTDKAWSPALQYLDGEQDVFYVRPFQNAYEDDERMGAANYGRWTTLPYKLLGDDHEAIAYAQPLILDDGTVYGVLGVELLESYMDTKLPWDELQNDHHGSYLLASTTSDLRGEVLALHVTSNTGEQSVPLRNAKWELTLQRSNNCWYYMMDGKPQIASIPLADLTSLDLQRFYKHLLDGGRVDRIEAKKKPKGLAPKTVRNIHQMIGSAYNLAMEQKLVSKNPAQGCALPKVEHKEMKTLTADQLSAFFQEARDSGVYELYYLDLATGLRRGELLGLKWTDVDFDRGVLKIQRAISRQNGKVVEAPLKTKNAYRTLPLSADAIDVLKAQKNKVGSSEWVFPSPTGGPMSPDSVLHMLQRVLKRAGLPRIRFHDLRHTFATMALQNGVDIKTVSSMLGHYSAGFTLDTYAHVTTDAQLKAAQTMGSILSRAV